MDDAWTVGMGLRRQAAGRLFENLARPSAGDILAWFRVPLSGVHGIKSVNRIGTISFTNERPPDFWAERGYDWYAGH
jgi:hypothetical protein